VAWNGPQSGVWSGIDFRHGAQREFILGDFARLGADYDYPSEPGTGFYEPNNWFNDLDARALYVLLRLERPARVIEVGSGLTSLLIADVNTRFLVGRSRITCVDPHPQADIDGVAGISETVRRPVQEVPLDRFAELASGDVLFVDSSHIAAPGSDVNFLVFEVLPILKPGVLVHFHDIFLPGDYPDAEWVQPEWNEQYVVQALLMFSARLQIVFASAYAYRFLDAELTQAVGKVLGGDSLWLRVTDG